MERCKEGPFFQKFLLHLLCPYSANAGCSFSKWGGGGGGGGGGAELTHNSVLPAKNS